MHNEASVHDGSDPKCPVCRVQRELTAAFNADPRSPRWRYYGKRWALGWDPSNLYFYTTQTVGRPPRYMSGVYRYIKTRGLWVARQERGHAKRKDAKARALKLYTASKGEA